MPINAQLIENIIFWIKLYNKEQVFKKERINLTCLVSEVCGELYFIAKARKIEFNNYFNKNTYLWADKEKLKKAIEAIILNAILYNKQGGIVEIYGSKNKGKRKLAILDTGIGIGKKDLQRIFDCFYRGFRARRLAKIGSGLGLTIANKVIKKHCGFIQINSEEGQGTAVVVRL